MRDELSWLAEKTFTEENNQRVIGLKNLAEDLGVSLPNLGVAWCEES
ncbi:MAG: hypothetical protein R2809_05585 [Flavobacteriales bacterium]